MSYPAEVKARLEKDAQEIISRYPADHARSALIPMLHLVQSEDGYVSPNGIALCADLLGLTQPQVSAVATFYTQFKRHPNGEYNVGVCTNALCGVMGGEQIFEELSDELGIGHDETTADGKITLEQLECNAGCDFAPVIMVNWEYFDYQTPQSARKLVQDLQDGTPVKPTRGPDVLRSFKEVSRTLAGFSDGLANQGPSGGPSTFRGLELAHKEGWTAPVEISATGGVTDTELAEEAKKDDPAELAEADAQAGETSAVEEAEAQGDQDSDQEGAS